VLTLESALVWVPGAISASYVVVKWIRVAQREHYLPGRVTTVAMSWARIHPVSALPYLTAWLVFVGAGPVTRWAAPAAALLAATAPIGLRTVTADKRLVLTPRVWRLLGFAGLLVVAVALLLGVWGLALVALLGPLCVDGALAVAKPVEARLSHRFVRRAARRLAEVAPLVVAVTGSFGKTTTKGYIAHFTQRARRTVASPGSYNNLLGLTRTINDALTDDTQVFVAEMGTYGPGEIAEMCNYFPPDVAAIVSIGDAHLERMGDRATIVRSKSEILKAAKTWVLNVDVPELAKLADEAPPGVEVYRCSTREETHARVSAVAVGDVWRVRIDEKDLGDVPKTEAPHGSNLAVAIACAAAAHVPLTLIARSLTSLPRTEHRAAVQRDPHGVTVIDDTYNSNPDGARQAVSTAVASRGAGGRIWVVTPGMFELGSAQDAENRRFAELVRSTPQAELLVVGRSNRRALSRGYVDGAADGPVTVSSRSQAQEHLRGRVSPGDVIVYENDLPDHLP